ncbi:MAG: hypothetical protein Q4E75_03390 [bacterium]|nr:hypothetical protein [bacterium]
MKYLKFNLTTEMANIIINVLIINEKLNQELSKEEQMALLTQKNKLVISFIIEFQKNNVNEINKYKELMDTIK